MTTPSTSTTAPSVQLLSESELVRSVLASDYEILDELGHGGMAVVFRAREKALDREVAIKVLPARLSDKEFVERFEHEARTAAKLEHPNIVPIYRVGRAGPNNDVIYFVMKLLRGQSLNGVLRERGKLTPSDVRRILMETASALGYAAKRNVVHRDIKPDNVMLDSEGRCVVTDFGIAKSPGGQQTADGTSLGTPLYMSPEQAMGNPLDGRSDIYSLGVVAYQCLVGKTPFASEDPLAVLYKHINEPLPQPTFTTDEERTIFAVIARMLAKKPDDRFQTGNEVIAALGGEISAPTLVSSVRTSIGMMAPTEMIPTAPWYMPWKKRVSRFERRAWIGGTVVVVAAAIGLVVMSIRAGGTAASSPRSAAATVASGPPVQLAGTAPGPARSEAPPAVALPDSAKNPDAKVVQPPKTPPKPVPSARAAAILAYDKLKSNCPKRDTVASAPAIEFAVFVDSVADRAVSDKMNVRYDVCGLATGTAFTTQFTLTKLRQRGFGQQKPHTESAVGTTANPRYRAAETLDVHEMSAGAYRLDVLVADAKKRQLVTSREFKITEK